MKIESLQTYNSYTQKPHFYGITKNTVNFSSNREKNKTDEKNNMPKISASLLLMYMMLASPINTATARSLGEPLDTADLEVMTKTTQKIGVGIQGKDNLETTKLILALKKEIPQSEIISVDSTSIKFESDDITVELIKQFKGNFHIRAYRSSTGGDYPLFYLNIDRKDHNTYILNPLNRSTMEILRSFPQKIGGLKFEINSTVFNKIEQYKAQQKNSEIMGIDTKSAITLLLSVLTALAGAGAAWKSTSYLKNRASIKAKEEATKLQEAERLKEEAEEEAKRAASAKRKKTPPPQVRYL